jgi:hypothetical protein
MKKLTCLFLFFGLINSPLALSGQNLNGFKTAIEIDSTKDGKIIFNFLVDSLGNASKIEVVSIINAKVSDEIIDQYKKEISKLNFKNKDKSTKYPAIMRLTFIKKKDE